MTPSRLARAWPYAAVAAVAALVFARGPFSGHPLYFRDLSLSYFPFRRFMLEGLRQGTLRFWNPYVHEGEPLAVGAISYPFDLLQLLRPDEVGLSFLLALHVPLAALWMMALARKGLGLSPTASAAAGLVYALGGFALSTVNLYVYAQALAWAPAAILGLLGAVRGDRRAVALAALAVGVLMSTTAAEVVVQAIVIAAVLVPSWSAAGAARGAAALMLGAMLTAPSTLVVAGVVAGSARAAGLAPEVVLAHSIHPFTLAQVVIAGFYGDTARLTESWWGGNFFPRGFPYFLSLYLGLATLLAAAAGAAQRRGPRRRLAVTAAIALLLALGRWGLATWIVEGFALTRRFRYPSKLFFAVHLCVALLAALGIEALARAGPRAWRRFSAVSLVAGLALASAPVWPLVAPGWSRWFAGGFFPPQYGWPARLRLLDWVLTDAASGASIAVAAGLVGLAAATQRLAPRVAAIALVALISADLLRAGAGLNPSVPAAFFTPSPEIARHHAEWRARGRIFTCNPASSQAYAAGRSVRRDHETWTFATMRDTAVPWFGVGAGLRTALSADLTMMVPPERLLEAGGERCEAVDRIIPALRLAGVGHVISLDPLTHPDLVPAAAERPAALAPLTVFTYALRDPLPLVVLPAAVATARTSTDARARVAQPDFDPRATVVIESDGDLPAPGSGTAELRRDDPGHIEVLTTTSSAAVVVIREGHSAGWRAAVDGTVTPVLRANGRHIAVVVPPGAHTVRLDYVPPGFRAGVLVALAGALVVAFLLISPRWRTSRVAPVS